MVSRLNDVLLKRCKRVCLGAQHGVFEVGFPLSDGFVRGVIQSAATCMNPAILKRQCTQWILIESATNAAAAAWCTQLLKTLEDMFVVSISVMDW